jgi:hypothetical protein
MTEPGQVREPQVPDRRARLSRDLDDTRPHLMFEASARQVVGDQLQEHQKLRTIEEEGPGRDLGGAGGRLLGAVLATQPEDHHRYAGQARGCDAVEAGRPVVDVEDVGLQALEGPGQARDQAELDPVVGVASDRNDLHLGASPFGQCLPGGTEAEPREIELGAV